MAEGKRSSAVLWIALGGLALVGMCCLGVGGMAFIGYRQVAEREARRMERLQERKRHAEERARRARETRQRDRRGRPPPPREPDPAPDDAPPPLTISPRPTADRQPRRIIARVSRAEGTNEVSVGDRCDYDVTVEQSTRRAAGYWCRAFVECNGVRLYGTNTPRRNGFFPCELFRDPLGVAGEDRNTTGGTGDPFFQIDTRADRMVVIDDETSKMIDGPFHVEATIRRVR